MTYSVDIGRPLTPCSYTRVYYFLSSMEVLDQVTTGMANAINGQSTWGVSFKNRAPMVDVTV